MKLSGWTDDMLDAPSRVLPLDDMHRASRLGIDDLDDDDEELDDDDDEDDLDEEDDIDEFDDGFDDDDF